MASAQAVAGVATLHGERFGFIHALRGVAALLVVWSHLSGFWLLENGKSSPLQDASYTWIVAPLHIFQNGGHLGVILFFLISGYIITHTSLREDRTEFAVKRVLRIFPPLVFAVIVTWFMVRIAVATDTTLLGVNNGGIWQWLASLVLLDGQSSSGRVLDVTWTLVVEVVFYALTFLLLRMTKSHTLRSLWVMMAAWVVLTVAMTNIGIFGENDSVSVYVAFLILGRVLYFVQHRMIDVVDGLLATGTVSLLYLVLIEWVSPGFLLAPGGWTGLEPLVSYGYALIIFLTLMRLAPQRVLQPFAFLGDVSYSLYLLHLPIGITVLNLLDRAGVPPLANTLIAMVVALGASYVAYKIVEVPFQRLAREILRRRRSIRSATLPVA